MKKGAYFLLCWGMAMAPSLWGQGIISDSEINEKAELNQSEVIPHRDLVYNPLQHSESGAQTVDPVLDEQTYFENNIIETGQIAVDRVYGLVPFPNIFPYNVLNPDKGYLRADNKWDVEVRATTDWEYNDNITGSPTAREESEIVSVGAGLLARVGSFRPDLRTGQYNGPYALALDYDVSYDRYIERPDFDSFNQRMAILGRIGDDTFIVRPYVKMGDVTSAPVLDPDRLGLVRVRFLQTGTDVSWRFNDLAYHGSYDNAIANQPDNGLINYESFATHQELGLAPNSRTRYYVYGDYQNLFPNQGSFVWQGETGVGYDYVDNDLILGRFRWKTRVGWQQITWQNNPFLVRDNSGIRLSEEVGFFLGSKWEWIFHVGRDHQIDSSVSDNGYMEDYMNVTCYWRPFETLGVGATYGVIQNWDDTNNAQPFLQRFAAYTNFHYSDHTILFARFTYSHSSAADTSTPDVVSFTESVGVEFRF